MSEPRAGEEAMDSASSIQKMIDPYEEAQKRKRLREAEEATADVLIGRSGEQVPITTWVDSYYWTCEVCGWLGKGHTSMLNAQAEAHRHMQTQHPEMDTAKYVVKDLG